MDVDAAHLAHAVGAGDRLLLDRRVPLRLGNDDNRCGLDVEADAAGLDLGDEDRRDRRAVNSSMRSCRFAGGTWPVIGPIAIAPSAWVTVERTSRKKEKTTTLRPFWVASSVISMRRRSLAESSGVPEARAMK